MHERTPIDTGVCVTP